MIKPENLEKYSKLGIIESKKYSLSKNVTQHYQYFKKSVRKIRNGKCNNPSQ